MKLTNKIMKLTNKIMKLTNKPSLPYEAADFP